MVLTASPERDALVASAERVLRERYAGARDRDAGFSPAQWQEFAELGWLAVTVAEANGGLGLGWSLASVLAEALAPAAMSEPLLSQQALAGHLLDRAQAGPLRNATLEAWLEGRDLVALAHHESRRGPCFGASLATRCDERGGELVLNGSKTVVVDGALASHFIVSAARGRAATALVLLARANAGLVIREHRAFDGRSYADLDLRDVRVSAGARLDFAAPAADVVDEALACHALLLAADTGGLAKALVRISYDYLSGREQFGRKLVEFQVLQHRLVDMHLATVRLDSLLELARCKIVELGPAAAAAFIGAAKAAAGSVGRAVGQQAVQLHGAIGMTDELIVGRYLKRLTANEFLGGHTEEHRTRYAELRGLTVQRHAHDLAGH